MDNIILHPHPDRVVDRFQGEDAFLQSHSYQQKKWIPVNKNQNPLYS